MEHTPIAQAFLKQHIPQHINHLVEFDSLTRVDRTNTDAKLKQRHRDIIYKAPIEQNNTLFACAEHQSGEDFMMPVRVLYYNADLAASYVEAHRKWPLIINFVLYHGDKTPYPYPSDLSGYYEYPTWGMQELSLRFHVIAMNQYSDREIITHGICAPMELLLKHSRSGKFELDPVSYRQVFQECVSAVGDEYIITLLTYATGLSNQEVGERVFAFIEEVLTDKKEIIMTYGQKLRQEGIQQEKLSIAKHMLKAEMHREQVATFTGLDLKQVDKLLEELL
jgi:predicted transposase YdaD